MGDAPGVATTLPLHMDSSASVALSLAGVRFGEVAADNPLLINAVLPAGWTVQSCGTSDYSDDFVLLDDQGRKRARMSYITKSFDPSARLTVLRRFSVEADHQLIEQHKVVRHIKDCGTIIKTVERAYEGTEFGPDYAEQELVVAAEISAWLAEHYPNWESPSAYWD